MISSRFGLSQAPHPEGSDSPDVSGCHPNTCPQSRHRKARLPGPRISSITLNLLPHRLLSGNPWLLSLYPALAKLRSHFTPCCPLFIVGVDARLVSTRWGGSHRRILHGNHIELLNRPVESFDLMSQHLPSRHHVLEGFQVPRQFRVADKG